MSDQDQNTPTYSIGEVCKRTGLTSRQIRYYEEAGLIQSVRTTGGHRRFTEEIIDRLLLIKELLREKPNIKAVREALSSPEIIRSRIHAKNQAMTFNYPRLGRQDLTSLYPVSNRAELLAMIKRIEGSKSDKA